MDQHSGIPRDIEAIRDLAQQASDRARTVVSGEDGRNWLLVPDGRGSMQLLEIVDEGRAKELKPHVEQRGTFVSKDSFIDYAGAFLTPTSRLFADLGRDGDGARISAILDFHHANDGPQPQEPADPIDHIAPGRCQHIVVYELRDSEEWTRWSRISGKLQDQTAFVRFLEENAVDIESPSGADILELARDFSAARRVNFTQTLRTQTGDTSFEYVAEAEAKSKSGHIDVPNQFKLRIPVFYGEPTMEVFAFLRWSIDDGSLKIGIELHRPVATRQALFEQIGSEIAARLDRPLHYGSVEQLRR